MSRFTVIGFTEAELGFVLAGLFAAIAGARVTATKKAEVAAARATAIANRALRQVDSLKVELEAMRKSQPPSRRSELTPFCREKGESDVSIGTVVVLGSNLYVLNTDTVRAPGVRERFNAQIKRSNDLECKYPIDVIADSATSGPTYQAGARQLRQWFYLRERR